MSTDFEKLLHDAMALSERDRAELAERLFETMELGFDEGEASWQETSRRIAELDQGIRAPISLSKAREVFRQS